MEATLVICSVIFFFFFLQCFLLLEDGIQGMVKVAEEDGKNFKVNKIIENRKVTPKLHMLYFRFL